MADESYKKGFNTAVKVILGIFLIVVGVVLIWAFRGSVIMLIKAGIGLMFLLIGAIVLALAKE